MAIRALGKAGGTLLVGPACCTSEHTEPLLSELEGGAEEARRGCWSPARVDEERRGRRAMRKTSRCGWFQRWLGELDLRIMRRAMREKR